MAIKTYKPTTPSRRHMTVSAFEGIDKKAKPERSLLENLKKHSGRNSYGRITVRHRGGGSKKKYRIIDFKRQKDGEVATVLRLEYDPNRTANIALIQYEDGTKSYILAPVGLKAGHKIVSGPEADILPGNCLPIANIPVGETIHNIELYPGKGAQLVRSAGTAAQLMAKENGMAQVLSSLRCGAQDPLQVHTEGKRHHEPADCGQKRGNRGKTGRTERNPRLRAGFGGKRDRRGQRIPIFQ